ncbi:hypothetical protein NQ317_010897 [Molorchus minor]|uniref:Uncharacterized protein n=1 Tax=Molorchus minor TaxID=1323400 RepID=A0ABQ9JQF6_9CUCU|nr:hypothetical protein NQ317_010897 [Molorchus minor]
MKNLSVSRNASIKKAGFVTESGGLVLEAIRSKIPSHVDKEKALKAIGLCQKEGKDACETVYLIHKCYFENMQKHAERTQKENQSQSQSGSNKETGKQ